MSAWRKTCQHDRLLPLPLDFPPQRPILLKTLHQGEQHDMMTLKELKHSRDVVDSINWEMTPEEAVRLYLEWGNNWARGDGYVIRSKSDYTTYFVVNCWSRPYYIYLVRRNSDEALELAKFELPKEFEKPVCELKGVYALDGDLRQWLKRELGVS
jgi:hypothetical protein